MADLIIMGLARKIFAAKDDMNSLHLTSTAGAPVEFPFEANHVRVRFGWNKEEFRMLKKKHLTETDWTTHKKRCYLSPLAVDKLSALISSPDLSKSPKASVGSIVVNPKPVPRLLIVCKTGLVNHRLVLACPAGEDPDQPVTVLRVRVRPGTVLRRRQCILALPIPPYTDYYNLVRSQNHKTQATMSCHNDS